MKYLLIIFFLISCQEEKFYSFTGKDINRNPNGSPKHHPRADSVDEFKFKIRNFEKIVLKDSTIVKFNVYSDCCQQPSDNVKSIKDSIIIFPGFESGALCDSYCDYLFEYHFSNEYISKKKIILK